MKISKLRKISFAITTLFIGTCICILVSEIGFRAVNLVSPFIAKYDLREIVHLYSAHPYLNHSITPNLDYVRPAHVQVNIPKYRIKTNHLGFRFDPLKFRHKEDNAFRIAVLGDSVIEGYQKEYTLPYLLVKELEGILRPGKKIEAINFGVMSYSPLVHFVNLNRNVLRYKPDLVIVHFDMTDVFDDNVRYKDLTVWDKNGNPEAVNPGIAYNINLSGRTVSIFDLGKDLSALRPVYSPYRLRIWLIEHSYCAKYIYFKTHSPDKILNVYFKELEKIYPGAAKERKRAYSNILAWCTSYDRSEIEEQIEFSFDMLDRIRCFLAAHKTPLLVITVPNRAHLKGKNEHSQWSRYPIERIESFCKDRKIPFHVPIKEFEAGLTDGKTLYFSDDMHPNYFGQQLWAKSLAAYISSDPLHCFHMD